MEEYMEYNIENINDVKEPVKDITLQEKLERIAKERKILLDGIFENQKLENGYDTAKYETNNKNLQFFKDGLLNIGNGGLFIDWVNFFCKLRGDDPSKQSNTTLPYYYTPSGEQGWYRSYAGNRPNSDKSSVKIVPKWEIITDKDSKEKLTVYLFSGTYLYQKNEQNIDKSSFYSLDNNDVDIIELNRPIALFFDDSGVPQIYVPSLSSGSKEVISNKFDENLVFRVDNYDTNYLNNLFLVLGGIYFSSFKNKERLIEIAKRTGSSTFASLIESFGNNKTEKFYNSFRAFSKKFLELKNFLQDKNTFVNRYVNVLVTANKTFRQNRTAHYLLNSTGKRAVFVPLSYKNEYSIGELKDYMPTKIIVIGNEVSCLYTYDFFSRKDYIGILKGGKYGRRGTLTPTRKKFLIDFGDACIENTKTVIEDNYKNIDSFRKISKDIRRLEKDLNDFMNFVCKSFSSVFFLNISDK